MEIAVMECTEWHRELVGHFSAHGARLGKAHMVRFGRDPPTDQTRMAGDEVAVTDVADATWLGDGEDTLVNRLVVVWGCSIGREDIGVGVGD
jgi:hypothetical protein